MASDQSNDQELQFKKRARRRLVGAIALVLLMVTILPMVLDDRSSKTPQQEIAIHIPSQDGPEFTSKVAPQGEPVEEVISEPVLSLSEQHNTDPDFEAPAVQPTPKPEPVKQAIPEPEKKEAAKPEAKPAAPKAAASSKPDPAKEKQKPVETKPAAAGSFLVQIGVFSDPINVKNLQDKLSGQGLKSHTEIIATQAGDKTRLRVGPFASREAAELAMNKVKAAGLSGMIISNK